MFILRQTSVKMAVLLHKQAKVPFILIIAVFARIGYIPFSFTVNDGTGCSYMDVRYNWLLVCCMVLHPST